MRAADDGKSRLLVPLALLILLTFVACSDPVPPLAVGESIDDGLIDLFDGPSTYRDLSRDELLAELRERRQEFAVLERDVEARVPSLGEEGRAAWNGRRKEIEELRSQLDAGLDELERTASDWEPLRERLVELTRRLRLEFEQASDVR